MLFYHCDFIGWESRFCVRKSGSYRLRSWNLRFQVPVIIELVPNGLLPVKRLSFRGLSWIENWGREEASFLQQVVHLVADPDWRRERIYVSSSASCACTNSCFGSIVLLKFVVFSLVDVGVTRLYDCASNVWRSPIVIARVSMSKPWGSLPFKSLPLSLTTPNFAREKRNNCSCFSCVSSRQLFSDHRPAQGRDVTWNEYFVWRKLFWRSLLEIIGTWTLRMLTEDSRCSNVLAASVMSL